MDPKEDMMVFYEWSLEFRFANKLSVALKKGACMDENSYVFHCVFNLVSHISCPKSLLHI